MPMIVDPSAPQVTPPLVTVSPDGYLRADVDELWAGVVLAYDAATPPDTARNLALNPSVEVNITDTQSYGPSITRTRVTSRSRVGAACIEHTHTAASSAGTTWTISPQTAGTTVQVGIWVWIPATGITTGQITWRSGTMTLRNAVLPVLPTAGGWVRISASHTLTAGQTCDRVGLAFAASTGTTWWADACMAEPGSALHPYVDGTQPGCVWDGTAHASTSRRVTTPMTPGLIRQVRIMRQDPDGAATPVRSADPAWAVDGVGTAYDHEAPLGVPIAYTATPLYADGTEGTPSALSITVPAPPAGHRDVWIKSVDEPGLSALVTVWSWPELTWEARIDSAAVQGSPYSVAAQDLYSAPASTMIIGAEGSQIPALERLLTTPGIRLIQTRPDYYRPDQFVMVGGVQQSLDSTPTESRSYQFSVVPVARPATAGQPMRMPNWSWDQVAAQFGTFDAVVGSYPTWAALSTNGTV
ncbi:hypothetical protein [Streptomyces sp. NPDC102283]|uniref:hypothetical protein n=1 Tax=Streptomyces sp. NPDC102283 TaxID=3366155 RepID=UPI00382ED0D6